MSRPLPRPRLVALIAGAVSATAFAPLDWWLAGLVCVAILLRLTHEAPSLKQALLRGWLFGLGHFTVGNNWIQHAFDYQDKMPPALGYLAVVLLSLYLAVYPALAMGLAWRFRRKRGDLSFVLTAAAAWIVSEYLRGVIFTGYPWNPLGVMWLPLPGIAQLAAWAGTYAMSGVAVLGAGTLYLASLRHWRPLAGYAAAGLAAALLLHPPATPPRPGAPLVRVLQPNIGQEATLDGSYAKKAMDALVRLSNDKRTILPGGPVPRLIVWPEGSVDYWIEDGYPAGWYGKGDPRTVRQMIALTLGPKDMALVGGNALLFGHRKNSTPTLDAATNSVFAIDPAGAIRGRYDKAHLVPYGEYLPMRAILAPLGLSRLVAGEIDFAPGPGPRTLDLPGFGKVGMQICYEIIFSGQTVDPDNRPAILFNPSNDAWFGSWGPPQHLAQARMRAIEEGLPILRSTPTGISAIVDAHGRIVAAAGMGEAKAIEAPMPAALPPTLFARLGNWLAFIVAGLLAAAAIAIRRRVR